MNRVTAIAISGGIDSLISAYLLKNQGHEVVGIHFITGFEDNHSASQKISRISQQLDIPIEVIDCRDEFKANVVDYFVRSYQSGLTPNPCLVCNPLIKFGIILDYAEKLGASSLATGHYARTVKDDMGIYHLLKGVDQKKDQVYFLSFLSQKQLSMACFPLGNMTKKDVKQLAKQKGLEPVTKDESQDVCFIQHKTYETFLSSQPGFAPKPGLIEDTNGKVLGKHNGLHMYTIGQRRGINCPASAAYYVVRLDVEQNKLVVGFKSDVGAVECNVSGINWINARSDDSVEVFTQIRYHHRPSRSILTPVGKNSAVIRFEAEQSAITPGQGAVFYRDDEVIGAGFIDR